MGRFQQVPGFGNPPQPPQPRYAPRFSTYELPKLEAMEARAGAASKRCPKWVVFHMAAMENAYERGPCIDDL